MKQQPITQDDSKMLTKRHLSGSEPGTPKSLARLFQHSKEAGFVKPPDKRQETSPLNGQKGGRPPFDQDLAAREFISQSTEELRHHKGQWLRYDNNIGWRNISEEELRSRALTWMNGDAFWKKHGSSRSAYEIVEQLKRFDLCGVPESIDMPCWLTRVDNKWGCEPCPNSIAFKQPGDKFVVFDIKKVAAGLNSGHMAPQGKPADSSFFSLQWAPFELNLNATSPQFNKYIEFALDAAERELALRFIGLCLTSETKFEIFLYLYGASGREGKTVLLDVIRGLLPWSGSLSYVDVGQLKERFSTAPLVDAHVNITGDAADIQYGELRRVEGMFKDLISGGIFEYERKHENKRTGKCKARFIFAGNSLPEFCDRSDAIWERMRICEFPRPVPPTQRDPDLAAKITRDELPGVVASAIRGLADILKSNCLPDTERGTALKGELRRHADHEQEFIEDSGYKHSENQKDSVQSMELYLSYQAWCLASGYKPLGQNKFNARARTLLKATADRIDLKGGRTRVLRHVRKEGL